LASQPFESFDENERNSLSTDIKKMSSLAAAASKFLFLSASSRKEMGENENPTF